MAARIRCYHAFINLLKSTVTSGKRKPTTYRIIIRPAEMYTLEVRTSSKSEERTFTIRKRKILRKIFFLVKENGVWWIHTNRD
jgi:hypothetical protein